MSSIGSQINSDPLILVIITGDGELGAPTLDEDGGEIVVVEDSRVGGVGPETLVARIFDLGASDGMSARESGCEGPSLVLTSVDVIDEDI